jgi:hypothetical protein
METSKTIVLAPGEATSPLKRHTRAKLAIGFGVAAGGHFYLDLSPKPFRAWEFFPCGFWSCFRSSSTTALRNLPKPNTSKRNLRKKASEKSFGKKLSEKALEKTFDCHSERSEESLLIC